MAGLDVPSERLELVSRFLDLVQRNEGSEYAYMPRDGAKVSMTAEGLLCRQYLGWKHEDPRLQKGVQVLLKNPPVWSNRRSVYYWYYGTLVCHHMEGEAWQQWNGVMPTNVAREPSQERAVNEAVGPREATDYGDSGGRLYVTCLSIYILEVYYSAPPDLPQGLAGPTNPGLGPSRSDLWQTIYSGDVPEN